MTDIKGTVAGTRVRVSVPFFIAAALWAALDADGTALLCLFASFLHEGGHSLALCLCGRRPRDLALGVGGIRLVPDPRPVSYRRQIAVLLSGPAVNLLSAAVLALFRCPPLPVAVHLLLGGFNLLPVEALDGGQALRCLLAARGEERRAQRMVRALSATVLLPLAAGGFFLLIREGNFTLFTVALYLLIRLFGQDRM